MTEHETAVALHLQTLIISFLCQKKFQRCLAEDIAGDMITGWFKNNSQLLQGGYPSKLPRCLCQEALSKALAVKKKSERVKNLDYHKMNMRSRFGERGSDGEIFLREARYNFLKKILGDANVEKLIAACGEKKPRQRDLAESIDMKEKRWRALRYEIRTSFD